MTARRPPSDSGLLVDDAGPDDVETLAGLMAASPLLRRYDVRLDAARAQLDGALRAGDLLLTCREDARGPALALAWVIASRILGGGAYLRLLLVAEGWQGAGIGPRLLGAAEERARAWANHLYLLATTDNLGARRFYERLGYRHVGDLPALARPDLDEALYHKTLRPFGERLSL